MRPHAHPARIHETADCGRHCANLSPGAFAVAGTADALVGTRRLPRCADFRVTAGLVDLPACRPSWDPVSGAVAALLLSASPTFLYQVVQPMSDVPAAACWLAALLLAARASPTRAAASGAVASLAILIRPNLAPLAGLIAGVAVAQRAGVSPASAAGLCRGARSRTRAARLDTGRPLRLSARLGIWNAGRRVLASNIGPNLSRYPRWITETHTGSSGCHSRRRSGSRRHASRPLLAWSALTLAVPTWAAYLPYVYFQPHEWFYTRFLLIAIAIMLMFASAVALSLIRRLPGRWRMQAMALMRWVCSPRRFTRQAATARSGPRSGAEVSSGGRVRARQAPGHRVRAGRAAQWKHPLLREPSDAAVGYPRRRRISTRCSASFAAGATSLSGR